jgi:hypothetical protein
VVAGNLLVASPRQLHFTGTPSRQHHLRLIDSFPTFVPWLSPYSTYPHAMRLSIVSFTTIALVSLLGLGCFAQFGGLPYCAVGFLLNSAINSSVLTISLKEEAGLSALGATGCHIPDFQCICSNQTYIDSLEPAFMADCDPPDVTSKLQRAHLCLKVSDLSSRSTAICLELLQPRSPRNHYLRHAE